MTRLRRPIAGVPAALMLVQATGCTTWKTVSLSVAAVENPKHKVRVVLKEGGTVTSDSVRARGTRLSPTSRWASARFRWPGWRR